MTRPDFINRLKIVIGFVILLVISAGVAWGLMQS